MYKFDDLLFFLISQTVKEFEANYDFQLFLQHLKGKLDGSEGSGSEMEVPENHFTGISDAAGIRITVDSPAEIEQGTMTKLFKDFKGVFLSISETEQQVQSTFI